MTFAIKATQLAILGALAGIGVVGSVGTSDAAVYCRSVGYPRGCVVRPAAVVVRPAPVVVVHPRRVIYCTRPGYPAGCVIR